MSTTLKQVNKNHLQNKIIGSLCKLYGIEQTTTCPYNPRGNAFCERFNHTLFGLLQTLTKEEKEKWPAHLPAPAPCDHWLGLGSYDDKRSVSKTVWVDKQAELIVAANKRALKNIKAGAAKNKQLAGGKELNIPDHNLVLLRDHPARQNKIQDKYKPDLYKVLNLIKDRKNAYLIQPVEGKNPKPQMAHQRELFDLGMAKGKKANSWEISKNLSLQMNP